MSGHMDRAERTYHILGAPLRTGSLIPGNENDAQAFRDSCLNSVTTHEDRLNLAGGERLRLPVSVGTGRWRSCSGAMEVTTARFLLRDFVEADRPAFLEYQADPRNTVFHGPDEARPEHAAHLFETFQAWASERPRLNYQLAIVHRQEPHALVGCSGLRGAERPAGEAELGLELAPDFWGRHGYAVEVGRALVDFGFGELMLDVISGSSVSANARIARVAEWFGAEVVAIRPGPSWMSARDWSEVHWRIRRARWAAHQSSNKRGVRLHRRPPPGRPNG